MEREYFILKSIEQKLSIIGQSHMSDEEIQKAFTSDELDLIQKAKYIRREGTAGNYKYIYDEPKSGEKKDGNSVDVPQKGETFGSDQDTSFLSYGQNWQVDVKKDEPLTFTGEVKRVKGEEAYVFTGKNKKLLLTLSDIKSLTPKSEKKEEKKERESGIEFKVGERVKIPRHLTTDPVNKQGETGVIHKIYPDKVSVKFSDGVIGYYQDEAVEKQSEKKEEPKEAKVSELVGKVLDVDGESSKIKNISQERPGGQYKIELENGKNKFINDFILDKLVSGESHRTPRNPYSDKDDSMVFKIKKSEDPNVEKAETGEKKVAKVMKEFKEGKLKDGHGNKIVDRDQAIAIALSEAGLSKEK